MIQLILVVNTTEEYYRLAREGPSIGAHLAPTNNKLRPMEGILNDYWPVTRALTGVAALNWGLVEFANTNLLSDTLGLSGDVLTGAFAAFGVLGTIALYNTAAHYID